MIANYNIHNIIEFSILLSNITHFYAIRGQKEAKGRTNDKRTGIIKEAKTAWLSLFFMVAGTGFEPATSGL